MNLDEMVCIAEDGEGRPVYKRLGALTKPEYEATLAILEKQEIALRAEMLLLETDEPDA